jgi:hypothetical protein
MRDFLPIDTLVPGMLGLYALAFLSGGIYYLEQRVSRIRDQFPKQGPLAALTGYAALSIGLLTAISVGGDILGRGPDFRLGALVAALAGAGFWVYHIHIDMTFPSRLRDATLALICGMLALLTGWWIQGV